MREGGFHLGLLDLWQVMARGTHKLETMRQARSTEQQRDKTHMRRMVGKKKRAGIRATGR